MEEGGSDVEDTGTMDLVDAAYMYILEQKYPEGCTDTRKRSIRKKAKMFVIRDGVLYFKKKKKRMVGIILKLYIYITYISCIVWLGCGTQIYQDGRGTDEDFEGLSH